MDYTQEQIDAVDALLVALFDAIPSLIDVRGHWYVSPGRKVDPNPLFPMDEMRARVLGRDEAADQIADEAANGDSDDAHVMVDVPGGSLNMRRWPSFNPNVFAQIPDGTVVPVLKGGKFDGRDWIKVLWGGVEGWIVERYTAPIIKQNQEA